MLEKSLPDVSNLSIQHALGFWGCCFYDSHLWKYTYYIFKILKRLRLDTFFVLILKRIKLLKINLRLLIKSIISFLRAEFYRLLSKFFISKTPSSVFLLYVYYKGNRTDTDVKGQQTVKVFARGCIYTTKIPQHILNHDLRVLNAYVITCLNFIEDDWKVDHNNNNQTCHNILLSIVQRIILSKI